MTGACGTGEMPRAPQVTFAVPVYNGATYLRQTLDSILAQRDPAFRLLVIDNCSTDATVEIARSYRDDRLEVILADVHVSMSENWNRALSHIQTPYGVLAHADDLYEPEYVEVMVPLIAGQPDAFVAHCRVATIDEHGTVLTLPTDVYKEKFWPDAETYCRPRCDEAEWLRKGNYILAPSAIYRMECVRRIGGFEPRFQFAPDWQYWLRGVFAGYRVVGTRRKLVRYRRHAGQLTKANEATLRRYREEIELLTWVARAGHETGCYADARPDYALVNNTLLSEFVDRLGAGDSAGAAQLAAFARDNIPGFRSSARGAATRLALPLGRIGGRALARFREWYLRHSGA
jgi:glycosyltransferase involved in cell wall biosynthesis